MKQILDGFICVGGALTLLYIRVRPRVLTLLLKG